MFELKDVEKAVHYLGKTDESYASAKARMIAGKERLKTVLAVSYLDANGSNVKERESEALCSKDYRIELDGYEEAILDFETMKNKRLRAELTVEIWRSLNSARTKGVMT